MSLKDTVNRHLPRLTDRYRSTSELNSKILCTTTSDLDLSGSRDVIGHVTIRLELSGFLYTCRWSIDIFFLYSTDADMPKYFDVGLHTPGGAVLQSFAKFSNLSAR